MITGCLSSYPYSPQLSRFHGLAGEGGEKGGGGQHGGGDWGGGGGYGRRKGQAGQGGRQARERKGLTGRQTEQVGLKIQIISTVVEK